MSTGSLRSHLSSLNIDNTRSVTPYTALNRQYRTKAKGSKKRELLADKVLTIINNLYINLIVFNYCGVTRLFKDAIILARIRASGN